MENEVALITIVNKEMILWFLQNHVWTISLLIFGFVIWRWVNAKTAKLKITDEQLMKRYIKLIKSQGKK